MEITIKKDIVDLRKKYSDDSIIRSFFENVVMTRPRRCQINSRNEIIIKNYGITRYHDNWTKDNPIMTGLNIWQLISEARISIDDNDGILYYRINIKLVLLATSILSFIFSLIIAIISYMPSASIWRSLKIGVFSLVIYLTIFSISSFIQYLRHVSLINDCVLDMPKK